jgi:hypothetical protein
VAYLRRSKVDMARTEAGVGIPALNTRLPPKIPQ